MSGPFVKTAVIDHFLDAITDLLKAKDGAKLQDFLQIEPPLPPIYNELIASLRQTYPATDGRSDGRLQEKCEDMLKGCEPEISWLAFPMLMKLYLIFMRDVNVDNLLETYDLLRGLLKYVYILWP